MENQKEKISDLIFTCSRKGKTSIKCCECNCILYNNCETIERMNNLLKSLNIENGEISKEECIEGLEDLIQDREALNCDGNSEIFMYDIKVLKKAIELIK